MISQVMLDLLIDEPYLGYLAAKVNIEPSGAEKQMRTVYKDRPNIFYNEEWYDSLSYPWQKGALIHELLHIALLHSFRMEDRDPVQWHMACDLAVTELMDPKMIHDDMLTIPIMYQELALILPNKLEAEKYYELLEDNEEKVDYTYEVEGQTIQFDSGNTFRADQLDNCPTENMVNMAILEELSSLLAATENEEAIDGDLGELTNEIYKNYKLNWRHLLKKFLGGQGRIAQRKSYKRASRRYDDLPGTKRSTGLRALVAVDESGSVSSKDVAAFHKELLRINSITGTDITAVSFDETCTEPLPLKQFVTDNKRKKNGGTNFTPIFELADRLRLPMVVIFTDGEGEAPKEVNQKVLWVLTRNGRAPARYGVSVKYSE